MVTSIGNPITEKGNKNQGGGKNKVTDADIDDKNKKRKQDGAKGDGKGGKPTPIEAVKNTSPVDASWIVKGESLMGFHKNIKTVPTLDGKPICIKYHVKGTCHADCMRKASHTDKFDDDTKAKFGDWVKACRKQVEGNN